MRKQIITVSDQRGLAKIWLILLIGVLTAGSGFTGYAVRDSSARADLKDKDEAIETLKDRAAEAESLIQQRQQANPTPSANAAPSGAPSQSTSFASANLGFSVTVPKEWVGQWRYQENGAIGISTASATFFLINKETKYQELLTVGKIPQAKYDDAKASGQPVGNPDNYLGAKGGNVYVMTFADGSNVEFKNFSYADAVKAARTSFKATFKTL